MKVPFYCSFSIIKLYIKLFCSFLCIVDICIYELNPCVVFVSSGVRRFEAKGKQVDGWGRDKYLPLSNLKNPVNGLLANDTIIFKVEINVVSGVQYTSKQFTKEPFAAQLYSMMEGPLTDIQFKLSGGGGISKILHANKCMLSIRSPVFYNMFTNNMRETQLDLIELPESPAVFQELLHFIYTDSCSQYHHDLGFVKDLLTAASKYQVQGLIKNCEARLSLAINTKNCISMLIFADSLYTEELKKNALQYIARNITEVEQEEEYLLLDSSLLDGISAAQKSINRRYFGGDSSFVKGAKLCIIS